MKIINFKNIPNNICYLFKTLNNIYYYNLMCCQLPIIYFLLSYTKLAYKNNLLLLINIIILNK